MFTGAVRRDHGARIPAPVHRLQLPARVRLVDRNARGHVLLPLQGVLQPGLQQEAAEGRRGGQRPRQAERRPAAERTPEGERGGPEEGLRQRVLHERHRGRQPEDKVSVIASANVAFIYSRCGSSGLWAKHVCSISLSYIPRRVNQDRPELVSVFVQ